MKNCKDCKHAEWRRNAAGNLHPSGNGMCRYPYKVPALPACMYWMSRNDPKPFGGPINRHAELGDHCVYFARKE